MTDFVLQLVVSGCSSRKRRSYSEESPPPAHRPRLEEQELDTPRANAEEERQGDQQQPLVENSSSGENVRQYLFH